MFCPNCGREIEDNSKFCGFCGATVAENKTEPVKVTKKGLSKKVIGFIAAVLVAVILFVFVGGNFIINNLYFKDNTRVMSNGVGDFEVQFELPYSNAQLKEKGYAFNVFKSSKPGSDGFNNVMLWQKGKQEFQVWWGQGFTDYTYGDPTREFSERKIFGYYEKDCGLPVYGLYLGHGESGDAYLIEIIYRYQDGNYYVYHINFNGELITSEAVKAVADSIKVRKK